MTAVTRNTEYDVVAVGWPQEVHRFPHRIALSTDTQSEALS